MEGIQTILFEKGIQTILEGFQRAPFLLPLLEAASGSFLDSFFETFATHEISFLINRLVPSVSIST